jgi:hypothetical protein
MNEEDVLTIKTVRNMESIEDSLCGEQGYEADVDDSSLSFQNQATRLNEQTLYTSSSSWGRGACRSSARKIQDQKPVSPFQVCSSCRRNRSHIHNHRRIVATEGSASPCHPEIDRSTVTRMSSSEYDTMMEDECEQKLHQSPQLALIQHSYLDLFRYLSTYSFCSHLSLVENKTNTLSSAPMPILRASYDRIQMPNESKDHALQSSLSPSTTSLSSCSSTQSNPSSRKRDFSSTVISPVPPNLVSAVAEAVAHSAVSAGSLAACRSSYSVPPSVTVSSQEYTLEQALDLSPSPRLLIQAQAPYAVVHSNAAYTHHVQEHSAQATSKDELSFPAKPQEGIESINDDNEQWTVHRVLASNGHAENLYSHYLVELVQDNNRKRFKTCVEQQDSSFLATQDNETKNSCRNTSNHGRPAQQVIG